MSIRLLGSRCGILAFALIFMAANGFWASPVRSPASPPAQDAAPALDAVTRSAGVDDAWWHSVSTALERQEYEATPGARDLQAPNRAQNLRTLFGPRSIEIEPRLSGDIAPAWRFGWETTGLGRNGQVEEAGPAALEHQGSRVTYVRPGWSEWYENSSAGLEQGFTIDHRPPGEGPLKIAGTLGGGLEGKLVDGAVDLLDAHGACMLRYGKLEVRDAGDGLVPSRLVLDGRTLAIEVDDRGAAYPLTVDPLMTSPAWVAESNQADAEFGYSVGTAGDVNGDGFSDVIVGAYRYENGELSEGRAFVYHGSGAGLSTAPAWTAEGNQANAWFGHSVATGGDVNGDGFSDVLVSALLYDNDQTDEGRAFAYHGSAAGLATTPAWIAESNQANASFGYSVATAGDVNGDGYSDVIIGAPHNSDFGGEGRAFVYQGSATGLESITGMDRQRERRSPHLRRVRHLGGDSRGRERRRYADVLVGADGWDNGQNSEGRAWLYLGPASSQPR